MKTYLPDTNVLVDFGRNPDVKAKLEKARYDGAKFVTLRKDELPLSQGQPLHIDPTVRLRAATTAAVDKGAGISWIAQYLKNAAVGWDRPRQITLLLAHTLAARKTKAVIDHPAHRLESRSGVLKSVEHKPHGRLY